ncbi:MAG: ABC transporter substrate-binding protein [Sphingomonadales bacterium]
MKELSIGVHYEPSGVDPHIGSAELALQMTNAVFDTLVVKSADGSYLPGLAERFEVSEDQCNYTFHLRGQVRFHDGTPLDAEAVAFSLRRAFDPANKSQLARGMLGPFRTAYAVDEHVVAIELDRPYGMILDALSQAWLAPVSPAAVAKLEADFARQPVGTGPFIFDHWAAGQHIVLRRNPDYNWGPSNCANRGPAHIDQLRFVFLSDGHARAKALQNGDLDAVFYVPPDAVAGLRADPRFCVEIWPIRGVPVCLMMNIAQTPTDDLLVRKAINHAIDQDALVEEVFKNEFRRAYGPVSQFTLGYTSSVETFYPHDLNKARAYLDRAGWKTATADAIRTKNGEALKLKFYALPVNFYPEFGEIVTRQLRQVGIEVEVVLLNPLDWIAAGKRGDHHLIPQGKYGSSAQLMSFVYHSRHSGPQGYGWTKRTAQHCPRLDAILETAEQAITPDAFVAATAEAQEIVMDEALIAPLHCNTNIVAMRKQVRGLQFDAIGAYPLVHDITIMADDGDAG